LNKALYLTYLIFRDHSITIEELMSQVDLGKNTCWKFKNKVLKRIALFKKNERTQSENWINILIDL
jgi:tryptophanyl-tRNA synthetase